jgi:hypothetical protein
MQAEDLGLVLKTLTSNPEKKIPFLLIEIKLFEQLENTWNGPPSAPPLGTKHNPICRLRVLVYLP